MANFHSLHHSMGHRWKIKWYMRGEQKKWLAECIGFETIFADDKGKLKEKIKNEELKAKGLVPKTGND